MNITGEGDALFTLPTVQKVLSTDRRRTTRQAEAIRKGGHPLGLVTAVRLHPDLSDSRNATPGNAGQRPMRCGTCLHRQSIGGYPKCGWRPGPATPGVAPPRYTKGAATDVRAWWPACSDWQAQP